MQVRLDTHPAKDLSDPLYGRGFINRSIVQVPSGKLLQAKYGYALAQMSGLRSQEETVG